MTEPVPGTPAWHADPSGRHQYRWWDGTAFTDQVADDGVTTTDAGPTDAPAPPDEPAPEVPDVPEASGVAGVPDVPGVTDVPDVPGVTDVPGVPDAPVLDPASTRPSTSIADPELASTATTKRSKGPLVVVALLVVAALVVAGFLVLGGDDGGSSGTGEFEGTVADGDEGAGIHDVSISGPAALTIELDPGSDLDAVVGIVVSDDDADRIEDLYQELGDPEAASLEDAFEAVDFDDLEDRLDGDQVVLRTDVGFAGDSEEVLLVVPFDVDVQVVVAPFEQDEADEDDYEIVIEAYDLDAEEDDDAEDLLEAVEDNDDIPRAFQRLAAEQLAGE